MLKGWFWPGFMKNVGVFGGNYPAFLRIFVIIHWYLTPQSGFMAAHLFIPFPHGGSFQEICSF